MPETQALLAQPAFAEPIAVDHAVIVSNNIPLTTHTGFQFHVRPVEASDKQARAEFFNHVSRDDLRSCFLSAIPEMRESLPDGQGHVDPGYNGDYLAFDLDDKSIVASAMVEKYDDGSFVEVSIMVRSDCKHRGMSWALLNYVIEQAWRTDINRLLSIERR